MAFESSLGRAREFSDGLKARARISAAAGVAAKASSSTGLLPPELGGNSPFGSTGRSSGNDAELLRHNLETAAACVRAIASRAAGQPLLVGSKAPTGGSKSAAAGVVPIANHPLAAAWANPNELLSGWQLLYTFIASLELAGRGFIWIRETAEKRIELWPLSPAWVQRPIAGTGSNVRSGWLVQPPTCGEAFPIAAQDMLYASYTDPADPLNGCLSPLAAAIRSVHANEAIIESQAKAFENGIFPRHAIVIGKQASSVDAGGQPVGVRPKLTVAQEQQILSSIKRRYQGVQNFDSPIILDSLIEDIKTLSLSPRELDFASSSKLTEQRIYRAFGINEISLGAVENANRASAAVADYHFCSRVNSTLALVGQAVEQWIGVRFGDARLTAWFEPCKPVDVEHQLAVCQALNAMGALSKNEARSMLLGLPPIVGGDSANVAFTVLEQPVIPAKALETARMFARAPSGKLLEIVEPEGDDE